MKCKFNLNLFAIVVIAVLIGASVVYVLKDIKPYVMFVVLLAVIVLAAYVIIASFILNKINRPPGGEKPSKDISGDEANKAA
jgi:hypothetical protein